MGQVQANVSQSKLLMIIVLRSQTRWYATPGWPFDSSETNRSRR